LRFALRLRPDVLPGAAAAAARAEVGARRLDPVRARLQHLDQLGAGEPPPSLGDPQPHQLSGDRVWHEHRPPVGQAPDRLAAVRHALQPDVLDEPDRLGGG
jgi:hypothetical protein